MYECYASPCVYNSDASECLRWQHVWAPIYFCETNLLGLLPTLFASPELHRSLRTTFSWRNIEKNENASFALVYLQPWISPHLSSRISSPVSMSKTRFFPGVISRNFSPLYRSFGALALSCLFRHLPGSESALPTSHQPDECHEIDEHSRRVELHAHSEL